MQQVCSRMTLFSHTDGRGSLFPDMLVYILKRGVESTFGVEWFLEWILECTKMTPISKNIWKSNHALPFRAMTSCKGTGSNFWLGLAWSRVKWQNSLLNDIILWTKPGICLFRHSEGKI